MFFHVQMLLASAKKHWPSSRGWNMPLRHLLCWYEKCLGAPLMLTDMLPNAPAACQNRETATESELTGTSVMSKGMLVVLVSRPIIITNVILSPFWPCDLVILNKQNDSLTLATCKADRHLHMALCDCSC